MKKYSFLVYHKEYHEFLEGIQTLGVLHVIEKESGELEDEETRIKYQQVNRLSNAIKFLEKRDVETRENEQNKDALDVLDELKELQSDQEEYIQQLAQLKKEKILTEPWGDFEPESIERLRNAGYTIDFYTCQSRNFDPAWTEEHTIEVINESGGHKYFILVHKNEESIEIDAEKIKLPENSLSKLDKLIAEVEAILSRAEEIYDKLAATVIPDLRVKKEALLEDLNFDEVVLSTRKEVEDKLMLLEGWVPDDRKDEVIAFLEKSNIFFMADNPVKDDKIPIKLKNNRFARLFEIIGDLYSRPSYREFDLTPYFAPFYWLFFGFCLGDAGYGLLILTAGLIASFRVKKKMKNTFKLVALLGASTILFGLIGGTFFGINLYEIRLGFYGELADKFDAQNKTINDHLFTLALILGGIQIIFGMFIKIFNEIKMFNWRYALGTIGWLIIILGGASTFLASNAGVAPIVVNILKWSTIILGAAGAFLFNNPERSILANIGSGIWDAYNMLTGIMGDLLSYIRLFALGISSAILGYVFNSLALEFAPDNIIGKILIMSVILAFGHGINLFMAALGSFVHPVRLTFVEFYKNAGFVGGGIKYSPFKKKTN